MTGRPHGTQTVLCDFLVAFRAVTTTQFTVAIPLSGRFLPALWTQQVFFVDYLAWFDAGAVVFVPKMLFGEPPATLLARLIRLCVVHASSTWLAAMAQVPIPCRWRCGGQYFTQTFPRVHYSYV